MEGQQRMLNAYKDTKCTRCCCYCCYGNRYRRKLLK